MRQKKKGDDSKMEQDKPEACVKCSKMQNGGHGSFEETDQHSKQTTLSTLKSVLKRSSSHKKEKIGSKGQPKEAQQATGSVKKHKNRVQFDETRNKYFEADYVILIHEEDYDLDDYYDEGSPYDDEDDDVYDDGLVGQKICCSNPNCNNVIGLGRYPAASYGYSDGGYVDFKYSRGPDRDRFDFSSHYYDVNYEEINQNGKKSSKSATNRCEHDKCQNCRNYFDFETVFGGHADSGSGDFGDQVTLSPPEGYKDGGGPQCCPHHGLQFQHLVGASADDSAIDRRNYHLEDQEEEPEEDEEDEEEDDEAGEEENKVAHTIEEDPGEDGEPLETEPIDTENVEGDDMQEEKRDTLKQRYIVETITMTTVTERRIVRETARDDVLEGAKKSGILKGGRFWKNSADKVLGKTVNYNEVIDYKENRNDGKTEETVTGENENDNGNGPSEDDGNLERPVELDVTDGDGKAEEPDQETASPESTELTLTFKLGQHVLVANSLKPNSAVRQLFPSPRFLSPPPIPDDCDEGGETDKPAPPKQFLVTAESLRLFEEAKNSKMLNNMNTNESGFVAIMPPISKNDEEDGSRNRIRRTIERNTLRRSLIRYPCDLRSKRMAEKRKKENSLEERIKQLTCGVDDEPVAEEEKKEEEVSQRSSPQGEETKERDANVNDLLHVDVKALRHGDSTSPSSNSSSSSGGSAYKKLTDIFIRKNAPLVEDVNCNIRNETYGINGPDLGNESILFVPMNQKNNAKNVLSRMPSAETRKQFLSTLAPLAACVASVEGKERLEERYRTIDGRDRFPSPSERASAGEESPEYTLDDIEEGLKEQKKIGIQPDVIAGTPQNETAIDELALFVQQDAGRLVKLKKRYSVTDDKSDEDDDYGFNKRPTVKGIKPRASGEAREAGHKSWPYYSTQESGDGKSNLQHPGTPQEHRSYTEVANANYLEYKMRPFFGQSQQCTYPAFQPVRIGAYAEIQNYQLRHPSHSPPPVRHAMMTPQPSPNPSEDGRNRTFDNSSFENRNELGIPEVTPRHPDGAVRNPDAIYYRRTVPNVHNPCLQMKFSPINYHQGAVPTASIRFSASCAPHPIVDESNVIIEPHYSTLPHPSGSVGVIRLGQGQQTIRVPYPTGSPVQLHLMAGRVGRCDSPQRPGSPQGLAKGPIQPYNQYLIAKGTQTAQIKTYQIPAKSIPDGAPSESERVDFEAQGKAIAEELQTRQKLSRSLSQEAASYQQVRFPPRSSSPVNGKSHSERGVPEGAASSSVQDGQPSTNDASQSSGNTIYYSMNV